MDTGTRLRRVFVAFVVAAVGLVPTQPAMAQDGEPTIDVGGDTSTAVEEAPPVVEEPTTEIGQADGGEGSASGGQGAADAASGAAPADDGAPTDGVSRDAVDDGDRTVQILDADISGLPEVRLVAAVPPALAGQLAADSFGLTENGQVRSADVAKLEDTIEVVVVIDTSGSMEGEPLAGAKQAAARFVEALDVETRVAVIGFGGDVRPAAGFDDDRATVTSAIEGLTARGGTALYDALATAADSFGGSGARRFVVVLSDGGDTASEATLTDAADALDGADASLYAVTLESPEAEFSGLLDLAARVDGQVVAASDSASLDATYAAIASRLTNQYLVTYRSNSSGTARVVLSVEANGVLATASSDVELGTDSVVTDDEVVAPEITIADPTVVVGADTGFLQSSAALYVGAGVLFFGIGLALFLALSAERQGPSPFERLNLARQAAAGGPSRRSGLAAIADRASGVADRMLEKQSKRGALDAALEKAGMDMRPGEFVIATIGVAFGLAAFGFVMFNPLVALGLFVFGLLGGRSFVNSKAKKRQKQFGAQLGDTLMMIAGSLRAGHGIAEAIDTVASQSDSPTCEEFSRAVSESRIGRDMVDSLYDIADRTGSEDFIWVVRAISINRELGGDLAEILDNVGETIRDRNRLRDQVRALSAEGKVSAMILFAMPVLVAIWVRISNPEYMRSMTDETAGKFVVAFAVFLLVSGGLWLKKLVNVEF